MAIQSCRAIQSADTTVISDFEITFKQIRFAINLSVVGGAASTGAFIGSTAATSYSNNANSSGALIQLGAPVIQNGTNAVTQSTTTFSSSLQSITP